MYKSFYKSPIGIIEISAGSKGITSIRFLDDQIKGNDFSENDYTKRCCVQIEKYFSGSLKEFNLELDLTGTEFQIQVWNGLLEVKFGETISYQKQSKNIGNIKKIRAVANANGKNPIAIVIPCHRIIGSNGSLTGYAGGLWRKKWLLEHEAKISENESQLNIF